MTAMVGDAGARTSWSIRTRLLSAFASVGLLVVGCGVAGLVVTRTSSTAVREIAQNQLPLARANDRLREVVNTSAADLRGYLITGDAASRSQYHSGWADYGAALAAARTHCVSLPDACVAITAQNATVQRWRSQYGDLVADGSIDRVTAGKRYTPSRQLLRDFAVANANVEDSVDRQIDVALARADQRRQVGLWLLLASTVLAALCLGTLAWLTVRQVVPPLTALRAALRRLAAGDLEARVAVQGPSELRAVASSVNDLAEQSQRLRDGEFERAQVRGLTRDLDRRMRQHLHAEAVAEEAVTGLGPMVRADRVHVRFIEDARVARVAAQWHTPALPEISSAPPGPTHPLESATAVAARGHQALCLGDVAAQAGAGPGDAAAIARDYAGVGSLVVAPVLVGQERIGVLVCARGQDRPHFDATDAGVAEAVAGDLARAVHHARLFEQQSSVVGQLRELDRTKSDFLSTISHELRTPLTSIAGYVEMMRDGDAGELQPMQDNMLEIVGRNTQRLRDLIEDVLMISKVESGAVRSERLPVALGGIIDHVVTALRPQAEAAGVVIDVFPVSDDAMLLGDPGQIDRMLLNLIGNGVKFTPRRGRVTISVGLEAGQLALRVQDTGIGIPAAELSSLFNRFFRASNATRGQIPGTGLGLAIVAGIAAAHDGRVDVDSIEGRGTTFTVTLPRWDVDMVGGAGFLRV